MGGEWGGGGVKEVSKEDRSMSMFICSPSSRTRVSLAHAADFYYISFTNPSFMNQYDFNYSESLLKKKAPTGAKFIKSSKSFQRKL
jgi:hypothetical protein